MGHRSKYDRILSLYTKIMSGDVIRKSDEAADLGVNERTIQRDIDDIRAFFDNNSTSIGFGKQIVYDRSRRGYLLHDENCKYLTNSEILAVCKMLLESRALVKDEMMPIIDKLINSCTPEQSRRKVAAMIGNEKYHYCEPHHGVKFVNILWDIGAAIQEQRVIEIDYRRPRESKTVHRRVVPAAIMFSEYYFYLAAFPYNIKRKCCFEDPGDINPTIYRIDRIKSMKTTDTVVRKPYSDLLDDGEFRKRVQFMYGGKLQTIRFRYSGMSVESVLDRLPTAKILSEENGVYTIEAETFGKGIEMWLRSHGDTVEIIQPYNESK